MTSTTPPTDAPPDNDQCTQEDDDRDGDGRKQGRPLGPRKRCDVDVVYVDRRRDARRGRRTVQDRSLDERSNVGYRGNRGRLGRWRG